MPDVMILGENPPMFCYSFILMLLFNGDFMVTGMQNNILTLGNFRNGIVFPHDEVCYFQSCHGHHKDTGYFRLDSMPHIAIIHLLLGGTIKIIDATKHPKPLSDALMKGVPTFCLVFNRAIGGKENRPQVCEWQTEFMVSCSKSDKHKPLVQNIRKMIGIYGFVKPAVIGDNVILECHSNFSSNDKPSQLRNMAHVPSVINQIQSLSEP